MCEGAFGKNTQGKRTFGKNTLGKSFLAHLQSPPVLVHEELVWEVIIEPCAAVNEAEVSKPSDVVLSYAKQNQYFISRRGQTGCLISAFLSL